MNKRKQKLHLSDDGFSLMELIVTILVSAVVTTAAAGFLGAGMQYYNNATHETTLQRESQVAELFVTELLQESGEYREIPSSAFPAGEGIAYAVRVKRGSQVSVIALKGKQLWYADVTADDTTTDAQILSQLVTKGKAGAFLADNVETFFVSPASWEEAFISTNGIVTVDMVFKVQDKQYTDKSIVSLRNRKIN